MALITDSGLIEIRDLLPYENDLLETADKERVDIGTKIQLAADEVRTELEIELERAGMEDTGAGSAGFRLGNVVLTDALRWWLHCHTLHLFYLECYGHQLNERFKAKQLHYAGRAQRAKDTYLERGVGVVSQPLPRPAIPSITSVPGSLPEGNYYVAVAWVNSSGRQSALSSLTTFTAAGATTMAVNPGAAPLHATGWHIFIGTTAENLARQTASPILPGQIWVMTQPWNGEGPTWGNPQTPDQYLQAQRVFLRG